MAASAKRAFSCRRATDWLSETSSGSPMNTVIAPIIQERADRDRDHELDEREAVREAARCGNLGERAHSFESVRLDGRDLYGQRLGHLTDADLVQVTVIV